VRLLWLSLSIVLASAAQPTATVGRHALLIANSAYAKLPARTSPKVNVDAMASALGKARFQPEIAMDTSKTDLGAAVTKFLNSVQPGDFALVFFSGYGFQEDDGNYLLPVDFDPKDTGTPIGSKAYSVTYLLSELDRRQAGTKMILLDASRKCPGLPEGLAQPQQQTVGTLVAFPAPPNQGTDEVDGSVNAFTVALVNAILTPGSTPRNVLDTMQSEVLRSSGQLPFVLPSPAPPFYFIDPLPKKEEAKPIIIKEKIELKSGQQAANPKDLLIYIWVPPGTFQMGCVPDDRDCKADESPRHSVTISKGFWITSTEVTVDAYSRFASKTGHPDAKPSQLGHKGLATDVPVINVTWDDGSAFCKSIDGRLPTEAEWEYAARGGNPTWVYPWGAWDPLKADYFETVNKYRKTISPYSETVPVHKFGAVNGYGLYGMAGNASEWVADYYGPYEAVAATDPTGPADGKDRVVRGGSWNDPKGYLRDSARDHKPPNKQENTVGFRCVLPKLSDGN
jgi:formylglycine-generating enzyme